MPAPCSRDGTFVLRAANRLLSSSRSWTRAKVSSSVIAGTGMPVDWSLGWSTVRDWRGTVRPASRADRLRAAGPGTSFVLQ